MLTDSQRETLLLRLRQNRSAQTGQIPRRDPALRDLPLSYGQEQLWFVDRFAPGLPTYNIPHVLRLSGALDRSALARALCGLTARHEALRTRLVSGDSGRPVQVIDPPRPVPLAAVDLTGLNSRVREYIHAEAMRPFDLSAGPLLRTSLARLTETEHLLVAVFHHTVFDGWSAGVFVRDLATLYDSEVTGAPSILAELPVQFADYAVWERRRLHGAAGGPGQFNAAAAGPGQFNAAAAGPGQFNTALADLERYWRQVLDGFETIAFPADRPRPVVDSFDGALAERTADAALLARLREVSRHEGTTLFTTVLAGLLALLYRYTGQTDLVVGTVSANRGRAELTPLIGFLVNTLPIRCDLSGDPAFADLLARVKDAAVGAFAHQDLPFGKLVETVGVERDASRAPVFQIALTYAEPDETPVRGGDVDFLLTDLVRGVDAAKVDLTFAVEARRGGLWIECCYKTALFAPDTIDRLLTNFETLLRGVAANPAARLSELHLPGASPYLLDAHMNPVPTGVIGDLYADGRKTGDRAYLRPDGTLVPVRQAKVRGVWVELGEVEAALAAHPDVAEAVVVQAEDSQLAAYIRSGGTVDAEELRAHLARAVPAAMIPAHLITVETFPLNADGQVDRCALPAPAPAQPGEASLPPATVMEIVLADIYAMVLGIADVAANDSFFDLGGNSLHAMRLVSALVSELGVDVGAAAVFLAPTPRQLAALLRKEHGFANNAFDGEA